MNGFQGIYLILAILAIHHDAVSQNFEVYRPSFYSRERGNTPDSSSKLIYDQARGLVLALDNSTVSSTSPPQVFGYFQDSWRLMPTFPDEEKPTRTTFNSWIYDSKRQVGLLFDPPSRVLYSYGGEGWKRLAPTGVLPPPARRMLCAFDAKRARALFLLQTADEPDYQWQTWEWTGSIWEQGPTLSDASPDSFEYVSRHDIGFLSGSNTVDDRLGQRHEAVWFYHPGDTAAQGLWEKIEMGGSPLPAVTGAALAYDPERDLLFRCGGKKLDYNYDFLERNSIWDWGRSSWKPILDSQAAFPKDNTRAGATPIGARAASGVAFDTGRDVLVIFGGIVVYEECEKKDFFDELYDTVADPTSPDRQCWVATRYWRDVLEQKSLVAPSTQCLQWVRRDDVGSPGQRAHHAMAYDSDRGVTVFFGGEIGKSPDEAYFNDTWEYDGISWKEINTGDLKPSPRSFHSMAYDPVRKKVVLYGGFAGGRYGLDDTWEYSSDGKLGRWVHVSGLAEFQGRAGSGLVFNSKTGRIVRYGGASAPFDSGSAAGLPAWDDTWEWLGSDWTNLPSRGPAVWAGGMVFDPTRNGMILFGGHKGSLRGFSSDSGDTWIFSDCSWIRKPTQVTGPSGRAEMAITFDAKRGRTVMVGGDNGQNGTGEEVWEYTATGRWKMSTPLPPGLGRAGAAMVYDSKRGVLVLVGGAGAAAPNGNDGGRYPDTWEGQSLTDVPLVASLSPSGEIFRCPGDSVEFRARMATSSPVSFQWYHDDNPIAGAIDPFLSLQRLRPKDSGRYSVVASTGCGDASSEINFSTHLHVGITIDAQSVDQTNTVCGSAEYFVEARGNGPLRYQWYLNGRPVADLEGITGSTTSRVRIQPALFRHEGRWEAIITDDCGIEHSVTSRPATLTLTPGPQWVLRSTNGPSARTGAAMVYDSQRRVTVLFGGLGYTATYPGQRVYLNDLWEWDGARWTQRLPFSTNGWGTAPSGHTLPNYTNTPVYRIGHSMSYDSKRGKVVLFGGRTYSPTLGFRNLNDTWEWDGVQWLFRATNGPSPRYATLMVFDDHKNVSVLFSGTGDAFGNAGPFEWDGKQWHDSGWVGTQPAINVLLGATMVYDSTRQLVLFGPTGDISNSPRNFWNWDGSAFSFANVGTPEEGAVAWRSGAVAYDSFHSRIAYFGGRGGEIFAYANNDLRFFDGQKWTGQPAAEQLSLFSPGDFPQPLSLVAHLAAHADPVSTYVWNAFSAQQRAVLGAKPMTMDKARTALTESLNGLLRLDSLYDPTRFAGVALSSETLQHLTFLQIEDDLLRFNRLLLEDAYPTEITRSPAYPTRRFGHTMVYDSHRRALVVHGGQRTDIYQDPGLVGGQTWEYIGVDKPLINQQPASQFRKLGDTAVFGITVASPESPQFQWYRDGIPIKDDDRITGSLGPTLTIRNIKSTDTGQYWAGVKNECGNSYSIPATLTRRSDIQVFNSGGNSTLIWDEPAAQLEQAPTINGPWQRLPDAQSPFDLSKTPGQMFYRLMPKQ